jgi:hypothetical protein
MSLECTRLVVTSCHPDFKATTLKQELLHRQMRLDKHVYWLDECGESLSRSSLNDFVKTAVALVHDPRSCCAPGYDSCLAKICA